MEIIDNFLEEKDFKRIQKLMTGVHFPWRKGTLIKQYDSIQNLLLFHDFVTGTGISCSECGYQDEVITKQFSPYFLYLEPLLEKINPSRWYRIRANFTPYYQKQESFGFHIDVTNNTYYDGGKTGILYVNTNNGYTEFEDGTKVDSVANRLLIFDNRTKHSGVNTNDQKFRILINLNWLP